MDVLQLFFSELPVWFVVVCLAVLGVLLLAWLLYYGFSAPPTDEEKNRMHPGDNLLGSEPNRLRGTLAVTVSAPPEKVWPYIAQLGQRRAGFYSFGWLERLFSFHIYNEYRIVDEWQPVEPGNYIFYHQCGIGSEVKEVVPGHYMATLSDSRNPSGYQYAMALVPPLFVKEFAWSWSFILEDLGEGRTRFFTRCDAVFTPFDGFRRALVSFFLGIPSFVMCKGMLRTIKACAEGRRR